MVLEGNAVVEALAAAHAAEVASMQEAFQARAQALEEDLHVSGLTLAFTHASSFFTLDILI